MAIRDTIAHSVAYVLVERPARKQTFVQLIDKLEKSGQAIEARAATAADNAANCEKLRHISGMERWGQRRLRVFLGKTFIQDEYDGYRPAPDLKLAQQREFFHTTRQATLALARQLADAKLSETATVPHNFVGKLSARGWLTYLDRHASLESKLLK
jgi:hypothetical protein